MRNKILLLMPLFLFQSNTSANIETSKEENIEALEVTGVSIQEIDLDSLFASLDTSSEGYKQMNIDLENKQIELSKKERQVAQEIMQTSEELVIILQEEIELKSYCTKKG